jgi:hypothetical protein
MNIRKHLYSFSLLLLAFGTTATISQSAYAKKYTPAPQIDNFYVTPVNQFTPGTDLTFTVQGTARGKVSVRVSGVTRVIPLQEIDRGVYEGDYTVSRKDRIGANSTMRATLTVRGRSSVVDTAMNGGAAPAAAAPAVPPAGALAIQRFMVTPINKIEPGADLKFALAGVPGAKVTFTIEGVVKDVPMPEVKSGQYEGSYTIRRLDHFPSNVGIIGTLEANGQAVRSRLNQALVTDAKPPVIKNLSPRENETVSGNPILVSGTFDDAGGVGIDTKNVRIILSGNDITGNATVTQQFFSYRADLHPGTYPVEVNAKDLSGNAVRRNWVFTVAAQAAPAATVLPLQILSHVNNAQVSNGAIEVRGRTAPDAKVEVQVQAIAQIAGYFGLNQQIYNQALRADANGNFAFTFQPQIPIPGARYEITMNASKADLSKEMKLVLFQQK